MRHQTKFKQTEIGKIPEDWEVEKIKEVITKLGDGLHGTPKYDDSGNYYFVNGNNLVNGKIEVNRATKKCSKEEFEKYKRELSNRTIFVSINGTLGNIALYNNEKIILGKSVCYFNVKNEYNLLFIKYILKNRTFQNHIHSNATGTTIKNVSLKQMREFKFGIPRNSNEQQSIAKILSDLDSKIQLNNQMNKKLEAIGQALFKRWFVDEMKDEWEVSTIGQELKTILGGTPDRTKDQYWNGDIPWVNSGKVNEFRITEPSEYITQEGLTKSATKLLPKGTVVLAITGATLGQVSRIEIDTCANQSVIGIIENNDLSSEYLYFYIKNSINDIISHQTGGAQQHINKSNVDNYDLLVPDDKILNKFNLLIKPIFRQISINCFQSQRLSQIRDSLLPKLMSGEIRVN